MFIDNVHPWAHGSIGSVEHILHPHNNLHKQINPLSHISAGGGGGTILFLMPEREGPPPPEATKVLSSCHWRAKTGKPTAVVVFTTGASAEDIEGGRRDRDVGPRWQDNDDPRWRSLTRGRLGPRLSYLIRRIVSGQPGLDPQPGPPDTSELGGIETARMKILVCYFIEINLEHFY